MPDEEIPHMLTDGQDEGPDDHGDHLHSSTVGTSITQGVPGSGDMASGAYATSTGDTGGGGMEGGWLAKGTGASSADPPEDAPPPP
jgi:hypothetical protein